MVNNRTSRRHSMNPVGLRARSAMMLVLMSVETRVNRIRLRNGAKSPTQRSQVVVPIIAR